MQMRRKKISYCHLTINILIIFVMYWDTLMRTLGGAFRCGGHHLAAGGRRLQGAAPLWQPGHPLCFGHLRRGCPPASREPLGQYVKKTIPMHEETYVNIVWSSTGASLPGCSGYSMNRQLPGLWRDTFPGCKCILLLWTEAQSLCTESFPFYKENFPIVRRAKKNCPCVQQAPVPVGEKNCPSERWKTKPYWAMRNCPSVWWETVWAMQNRLSVRWEVL